jgi:hypothetical protein
VNTVGGNEAKIKKYIQEQEANDQIASMPNNIRSTFKKGIGTSDPL